MKRSISYNGLWKSFIDNNLNKTDLIDLVEISTSKVAKMGKCESVSFTVLENNFKK